MSPDAAELPEWPEPLMGGKYVRLREKQLDGLRGEYEYGNRKLFLDDVFIVYLLAFFNPAVRSLRTIEDLSQTRQAQKHLSMPKVCKSTLSDFNALSDPQRLTPIIEALGKQLARMQAKQPASGSGDLHELLQKTVAVDGTFLPAAAGVAWAYKYRNNHRGVRSRADRRPRPRHDLAAGSGRCLRAGPQRGRFGDRAPPRRRRRSIRFLRGSARLPAGGLAGCRITSFTSICLVCRRLGGLRALSWTRRTSGSWCG